jgi:hypothetical protein
LKNKAHILILLFAFLQTGLLCAQESSNDNLAKYYHHKLHFGFTLGVNKADFIIHPIKNLYLLDTLKTVRSKSNYGFNIGIITEYAITEYLCIRFVPDLSFAARSLEYTFVTPHDTSRKTASVNKLVESTFIDFPLDLKLRSKRLHDFAACILVGGKYSIDLASQKNVATNGQQEAIVKLRKNDWGLNVGCGADFFLPYFKFGIEIKYTYGFKDLIVHDDYIYSKAIEKLNTKMLLISFTFEG